MPKQTVDSLLASFCCIFRTNTNDAFLQNPLTLTLTLVPGTLLVGDSGVRTPAQNHRSSVLQRDPNPGRAEQRARHLWLLWCFWEPERITQE